MQVAVQYSVISEVTDVVQQLFMHFMSRHTATCESLQIMMTLPEGLTRSVAPYRIPQPSSAQSSADTSVDQFVMRCLHDQDQVVKRTLH